MDMSHYSDLSLWSAHRRFARSEHIRFDTFRRTPEPRFPLRYLFHHRQQQGP